MNYDYDLKDFDKPRRDSGPDPLVTVKMSDLTGEFTDLDWNTFRIIVSEGISEKKRSDRRRDRQIDRRRTLPLLI